MPTPVDSFYDENQAISDYLGQQDEISLKLTFDSVFSKSLLIAATSFFEGRIQEDIRGFIEETTYSPLVAGLIQTKVIHRQYHTYFDWDKQNANQFFRLFGEIFLEFMRQQVQSDQELDNSIRAFLSLGNERNRIVHVDFAVNQLEKTAAEVYELYQQALQFVDALPEKYRECAGQRTS